MGPPEAFQKTTQQHCCWVERKKQIQKIRDVVYGGSFRRGRLWRAARGKRHSFIEMKKDRYHKVPVLLDGKIICRKRRPA